MPTLTSRQKISLRAAADLTFVAHLAVVLIVSVGWLVPQLFYVYLALFAATLYSEIVLKYCPLTRLEFGIRKRLDPAKEYDSSCIMHYGRALFGLRPRPAHAVPAGAPSKKNTFLAILGALFVVSIAYRFLVL